MSKEFGDHSGRGASAWVFALAVAVCGGAVATGCEPSGGGSGGDGTETSCTDGKDNDGDGMVDCADIDCAGEPICMGEVEICDNGLDEDGDGDVDCADSECESDPACVGVEVCDNGLDDDGDGFTDCDDPACVQDPACETVEHCENAMDDDGDGLTDCDDTDCEGDEACLTDEVCSNDIDDDGDGLTDCADDDCTGQPACVFGDLSCKAVRYCYACCASGDQACMDACYAEGTAEAKDGVDAIQECAQGNCTAECDGYTPEECETCLNSNCVLQLSECDWQPEGTGVCLDLYNCVAGCARPITDHSGDASTCPTNEGLSCRQTCYGAADLDAVEKMRAWLFCMEDNCYPECYGPDANGTDCQNCYLAACSAEVSACQDD